MATQPKIAQAIADCIAAYSEIELNLGLALSVILRADIKVTMAMYAKVENRSAQGRMIRAAIEASDITENHKDFFYVILNKLVSPCMKDRDKIAHWPWGYSPDLPDALLLFEPIGELEQNLALIHEGHNRIRDISDLPYLNLDHVFVVKEPDLLRLVKRLREAERYLRNLWMILHPRLPELSPQMRAEMLRQLSATPQIREGLRQLREQRKSNPRTHPPGPADLS